MLSFYFILLGAYLYYARSKYFPETIFRPLFAGSNWAGFIFLLTSSALFIRSNGWAGGLLLAFAGASLAMVMIQFFAVLGKRYFYGLMALVHGLVLIQLISYAR
jgi:hypothetical protein